MPSYVTKLAVSLNCIPTENFLSDRLDFADFNYENKKFDHMTPREFLFFVIVAKD